jgi:predicted Zn-dependent protease
MQQAKAESGRERVPVPCRPQLRKRSFAVPAALCLLSAGLAAPTAGAQGIPIIRDTEIETLLKDYARPILRAAGLEQQNIRMRIVNSQAFNAFVLDGGNIFIHTGALMTAETPNEVIGVIAHETGQSHGRTSLPCRRASRGRTSSSSCCRCWGSV